MLSHYMKMPPHYFRDLYEMTLSDLEASVGVMPRDVFEKLRCAFKFRPHFEVCNMFNVKYVLPHRHFIKEEPNKKEEPEKNETKIKEVVSFVKTKEES
jgi:hypothetical protein